ncbi:MAG: hypothetical protein FJZ58_04355 [Chlamydiae bacterium]|nr:hypothetical protein [Chlamydiota bacterium]
MISIKDYPSAVEVEGFQETSMCREMFFQSPGLCFCQDGWRQQETSGFSVKEIKDQEQAIQLWWRPQGMSSLKFELRMESYMSFLRQHGDFQKNKLLLMSMSLAIHTRPSRMEVQEVRRSDTNLYVITRVYPEAIGSMGITHKVAVIAVPKEWEGRVHVEHRMQDAPVTWEETG